MSRMKSSKYLFYREICAAGGYRAGTPEWYSSRRLGNRQALAGRRKHYIRIMCLLIVQSRVHRDAPLVVAANRDELLARPAISMTVLEPGIVGGRDLLAGGTWLALNRQGVFAGLTNL